MEYIVRAGISFDPRPVLIDSAVKIRWTTSAFSLRSIRRMPRPYDDPHRTIMESDRVYNQICFSSILLIGQFWRKTGGLRPFQRGFDAILLSISII